MYFYSSFYLSLKATVFASALIVTSLCAYAFPQDAVVYTDGELFYARGDIDQELIIKSEDAARVIQAALDSISDEGGEVLVKSGRYPITRTLTMKSNTSLLGRGRGTQLMVNIAEENASAIFLGNLKGSVVNNLALVSVPGNQAVNGIALGHCGDCKIIDVYVQGFPMHGIYLGDNSFLCEIRGCSLAGNQKAGLLMENLAGGGRGGDYVPNLVSNCIVYGGGMGFELSNVLVANLVGCMVYQTEGTAFYLHSHTCSIVLSGCRTFQVGGDAVFVDFSHEITITGNTFCWQEGHGIVLDNSRWGAITGNNIIDSGSTNIFDPEKHEFIKYQPQRQFRDKWPENREMTHKTGILMRNMTKGFTVTGNAIFNWPVTPTMEWGIYEDETCVKNVFVGNNINKAKGDISSSGEESFVSANVSELPVSFHGKVQPEDPSDHIFQYFDTRYIESFIEE